jgi:glycosyltransferase involved in cell wall biosynthesis
LRIAIVSPFVDRHHGTERAVAELVERLAWVFGCEVHLFAQRVADLKVSPPPSNRGAHSAGGAIYWHRVAAIPGPQLLRFTIWFILNRLQRTRGEFDLVISPGINCLDADVVIVHALFCRLVEVGRGPRAEDAGSVGFFRELHRQAYYFLLSRLERKTYADRRIALASVSRRTALLLDTHFCRDDVRVVANGVDTTSFSPSLRLARRESSRSERGLKPADFVLLLIGNDLRTKGIYTILQAMAQLPSVRLLIVGGDAREPYDVTAAKLGVLDQCIWEPSTSKILDCYAAADVYVSPSKEDSFGLPVLEAMACGLPVITSSAAGVSELVKSGVNGFVFDDPGDSRALAQLVAHLHRQTDLRRTIGEAAALTAREYTWDRNAAEIWQLLSEVASQKAQRSK